MTRAIEILAPSHVDKMKAAIQGIGEAQVVIKPSKARKSRMLVGWLSDLAIARRRSALDQLLNLAVQKAFDMPFVLVDTKSNSLTDHLMRETLIRWATIPGFYLAPDFDAVRRMIKALSTGAEDKLIASAMIDDGNLVVWSCEPKRYRVAVSDIPALSDMSSKDLARFKISGSGSRIHWPKGDVDLGLDTVQYFADPNLKKMQDTARRTAAARYASAIKALRVEKGLKQSDIDGLTDRQIRRLESGENIPQSNTLEKLANAHDLGVDEYLGELAKRSRSTKN